ncbi:MAG: glycosyltransferase family 2 protein [Candidatus Omnitrophica bacterium]|nr:glycosyltransferase family 2 protein [Candidatus Omnitrophota bacterium]
MKLSVLIPAYNEEATIAQVVHAVKAAPTAPGVEKEIIIVNDGSSDGTARALEAFAGDAEVRIFHQSPNQGKTAALRRGIREAFGDLMLVQDADLEYSPSEYPRLLAPLLEGRADIVYGSRFLGSIRRMEHVNRFANVFSNVSFNILFGAHLTDINTCFKLFYLKDIRSITVESDHFAFETEVTAKLVRKGLRVLEVPIEYHARSVVQGKKINWPRALGMYWAIIHYRFAKI